MGGRDDSPEWHLLPAEDLRRLDQWIDVQDGTFEHRGWFDDGRSDQPVGLIVVHDAETGLSRLVLKICASKERALSLGQAWKRSGPNFRTRHLLERLETIPLHSRWAAVFRIAAGGLDHQVSLSARADDPDFPEVCRHVVDSVIDTWNDGILRPAGLSPPVRQFLHDIIGKREDKLRAWAQDSGIDVDGWAGTVERPGWTRPLMNPFLLLAQEQADRLVEDVLVGRAHGDLSGRNIRVPPPGRGTLDDYVLIDADHFDLCAPLARDPMHLLVALALDQFDGVPDDHRQDLIEVIVAPGDREPSAPVARFRAVSAAIWEAAAGLARRKGFGETWTEQCLLALVGVGLVHVGRDLRTDDPDSARAWCFDLAARAADAYLAGVENQRRDGPRRTGQLPTAAPAVLAPVGDVTGMLDHDPERQRLRSLLGGTGHGVVVVNGPDGVGKSMLVRTVLADLRLDPVIGPELRVWKHEVVPGARFDVKTLIDDIAGGSEPAAAIRFGESSLTRLAATLEAVGDRRVVVVVEAAHNLLHEGGPELVDLDLDEALEALATTPDHRVCVVLVTRVLPVSPIGATWPATVPPVSLPKLPYPYFLSFLAGLDRGQLGLSTLDEPARRELHQRLESNPRRAELVHAVLTLTDSGDPAALVRDLSTKSPVAVAQTLPNLLMEGISEIRRDVLAALSAYRTPVHPDLVVALVGRGRPAERIRNALEAVTRNHLARRTDNGRYYVPAEDAEWMLQGAFRDRPAPDEERAALLWKAANELSSIRVEEPRELADLEVHFAELDALLRAGRAEPANQLLVEIGRIADLWNCGDRLLGRREVLVEELTDPVHRMANDNELGKLYAARGAFDQASVAYERAERIAVDLGHAQSRLKIVTNRATLDWQRNDTASAAQRYEQSRLAALSAHEPEMLMGALEGLADCHRRWGDYDAAFRNATEALAVAADPDYPDDRTARDFASTHTVNIFLKMARWYAELGRLEDARRRIDEARDAEVLRHDDWLLASFYDGHADLALFEGDLPAAMARATAAIERAGQLHDPVTLLQARTTMCLAHLIAGSPPAAAGREIERAARYRSKGRTLIALALQALLARTEGRTRDAGVLFDQILGEANARLDRDDRDFQAWDYAGFARCGRALDGGSLDRAVKAFETARARTPPTPGLVTRLLVLVEKLDAAGTQPGHLRPVTELLAQAAGR